MRAATHDSVNSRHLLADHEPDADQGALAVRGDSPHLLEECLGGGVADEAALVLKLGGHLLDFGADEVVVGGKAFQVSLLHHSENLRHRNLPAKTDDDAGSTLPVILASTPTRALGANEHAKDEENSGSALKSQRDDVDSGRRDVQETAVVDPVRDHYTRNDEQLVEGGQGTTNSTRRALGDVQRRQSRRRTNTQPSQEATDIHDCYVTVDSRCSLENNTNGCEDADTDEHEATSVAVGQPAGEEAGGETTSLESRDDVLLHEGSGLWGPVDVAELLLGAVHGEDARDGTSVPTEEHAAEARGEDEGKDAPVVDLVGISLHRIVADDGPEDPDEEAHRGSLFLSCCFDSSCCDEQRQLIEVEENVDGGSVKRG